jgi:tRNA(Ile)-lysidine synthase
MMIKTIDEFARRHEMFPPDGLILCGVSGGADSMCLLCSLRELSQSRGFSVAAAHFNHKLRGGASDGDEAFVRDFCIRNNITLYTGCGDVASEAEQSGIGIEEAARNMRYDFLLKTASSIGADRIATAHNADDNAETVIMKLTRGAGLRGLGGIPPVRGIIIRPLLTT